MNKKGDVWVSTVLYTLITVAVIALVLAAVTPMINKNKDKAIIDQTTVMLNQIDDAIQRATSAEGTRTMVELTVKKGTFFVNDSYIDWQLDSNYVYSEIGQTIQQGKLTVLTTQQQENYLIDLKIIYPELNIKSVLTLQSSETPYKLFIENQGYDLSGKTNIIITSSSL
jgi:type II secretory pathway pseudopilin PulG